MPPSELQGNFKEGHYIKEGFEVRSGFALDGISGWDYIACIMANRLSWD
jgi:hypothetical protein